MCSSDLRGVKDDTALGGFRWEAVGENRFNDEPTLNVDDKRDAQHPSAVFAETDNAVPWITWHELGADRPGRVFTEMSIDAPYPRDERFRTSAEYAGFCRKASEALAGAMKAGDAR